jgi:hypothetical protein
MKVEAEKKSIVVNLSLEQEEAEWLRGFIQNNPRGDSEPQEHKRHRYALFKGLSESLGFDLPDPFAADPFDGD